MDTKLQSAIEILLSKQKYAMKDNDAVLVIIARGDFSSATADLAREAIEQLRCELVVHGMFIIAEPGLISADP
jgi:hypothetical protein